MSGTTTQEKEKISFNDSDYRTLAGRISEIKAQETSVDKKLSNTLKGKKAKITDVLEGSNTKEQTTVLKDPVLKIENESPTQKRTDTLPKKEKVHSSSLSGNHGYTTLTTQQAEESFFHPKTKEEQIINQMLRERIEMMADEKMKGLAMENTKKAPLYKKLFVFAKGIATNLTSSKEYEKTVYSLLYKDGIPGVLSEEATKFYKQLHESVFYAEKVGGTEGQLLSTLKDKALKNIYKKPRSRIAQNFLNTGFGRSLSARFGQDGSFSATMTSDGGKLGVTGLATVGLIATAGTSILRSAFRAIPIVGAGVAAGLFGAVNENKRQKGLKALVETHLAGTPLAGLIHPTFEEVRNRIMEAKNPYLSLRLTEHLLDKAMSAGRQDREAGMMGINTLKSFIKILRKDFDEYIAQGGEELLQDFSEEQLAKKARENETMILKENRKRMQRSVALAVVLGSGIAGFVAGASELASYSKGTPTSSLNTILDNAKAKVQANHSYVKHGPISSFVQKETLTTEQYLNNIDAEHIDGKVTFGNTEYVVLRANDGIDNRPIFALPDGRIPYNVYFDDANAEVSPEYLAHNTRELKMNIGGATLRPVADNRVESPIEVHLVNKDTLIKKYQNTALTEYKNGKRIITCTPEYVNEELMHAAFGISKEPRSHLSAHLAGTKGYVDGGEQALIDEKKFAIENTTKNNALPVTAQEVRLASATDYVPKMAAEIGGKKEYVIQLYNELVGMKSTMGNPEATKAALEATKIDLARYLKMNVSEGALQSAEKSWGEVQYGNDGFAKFFGSAGSNVYERNQVAGRIKELIAKGYDTTKFDDWDNSIVNLEDTFKGNGKHFFDRYTSMLESDPSPAAKQRLIDAWNERLSDIKKENYFTQKGVEAVNRTNNGIFPDFTPATANNVRLYSDDILAEEFRIKNKLIDLQKDLEMAMQNKKALEDQVQHLQKQYIMETAVEEEYNGKLKLFNQEQDAVLKYEKTLKAMNATTSGKVDKPELKVDNDQNTSHTENKSYSQKAPGAVDPLEELRNNAKGKSTTASKESLTSHDANHSKTNSKELNQQPYYIKSVEESEEESVTFTKYIQQLDSTVNGQATVNRMLDTYFPSSIYPTPGARADAMIDALKMIKGIRTEGSKYAADFMPRDAKEIGNIMVGDYTLNEILASKDLTSKFAQAIIDTPTNSTVLGENGQRIILSDYEMSSFDYNPKNHAIWETLKSMTEWLTNNPKTSGAAGLAVLAAFLYGKKLWNETDDEKEERKEKKQKLKEAKEKRKETHAKWAKAKADLRANPTDAALITAEATAKAEYEAADTAAKALEA